MAICSVYTLSRDDAEARSWLAFFRRRGHPTLANLVIERVFWLEGEVSVEKLLPLMDECVARFPRVKLFSLPTFVDDGGRRLELGVRGGAAEADRAIAHLRAGVEAAGFRYEDAPVDASRA